MDKISVLKKNLRIALLNHFGQNAPIQEIANGIKLSRSETSRLMNEKIDLSLSFRKFFEIEELIDVDIITVNPKKLKLSEISLSRSNYVTAKIKFAVPWINSLIKNYRTVFAKMNTGGYRPIFRERPAYISFNLVPENATTGGYHIAFIKPSKNPNEIKIQFIVKNDDFKTEIESRLVKKGNTITKYDSKDIVSKEHEDSHRGHPFKEIGFSKEDIDELPETKDVIDLFVRVFEVQKAYNNETK